MAEKKEKKQYCPICKRQERLIVVKTCSDAYNYVMQRIKKDHPDWVQKDGACPKCLEYYERL